MAAEDTGQAVSGEGDDLSRFLIRSPTQIGQILSAICDHREIVTAYFNRSRQFLLTAIVHVDAKNRIVKLGTDSGEPVPGSSQKSGRVTEPELAQ